MGWEWKRRARQDTQAPATERAGLRYGLPKLHRVTPRLYSNDRATPILGSMFRYSPSPIVYDDGLTGLFVPIVPNTPDAGHRPLRNERRNDLTKFPRREKSPHGVCLSFYFRQVPRSTATRLRW
jgi:hypothetical protein